jgi:hypothetical protein
LVIERAGSRCEYCQLAQVGQAATFHIDHIVQIAAGGETTKDNLALACVACSLHKAARQVASDPETGNDEPLFHPRLQQWSEHFRWEGVRVVGLTPTGRATVAALKINCPVILAIRAEEACLKRHPPG